MKRNRIAAGALALALGLGAIAPAVAAENGLKPEGKEHAIKLYEDELKKVNKLWKDMNDAELVLTGKDKALKEAKAAHDAAIKAFEGINGVKTVVNEIVEITNGQEGTPKTETYEATLKVLSHYEVEGREALKKIEELTTGHTQPDLSWDAYVNQDDRSRLELKQAAREAWLIPLESTLDKEKYLELSTAIDTFTQAREVVQSLLSNKDGLEEAAKKVDLTRRALNIAQNEYDVALANFNAAKTAYKSAVLGLEDELRVYGLAVQAYNDGIRIVDKGDSKVEAPKKADYSKLEEVRAEAIRTLDAARLIIKNWPETVKEVRSELDALIAKQEANLKLADEMLAARNKKVSFIATAYAADATATETEADKVENLINNIESTTSEIKEKLDQNEANKKAENEKKEEAPAETKTEEKTETKTEEKKEEAPVKKAGSNAKTGIAGVAGVAGILAAASVAYAASKRD